ncbi:MAG: 4-hydroxy-3-methylbut-2-enyl diphosphate reductase [Candidatus Woesearchaeota archaeon]|nr:4-hydroxy-3-methylbut-2-enyl diphosphate reductase [Candidatus Woesearchaeota archaeon]
MKIILAEKQGMCFGVKRAVDIAEKAAKTKKKGSSIYMYGPLVHNKKIIGFLEAKGIKSIKTLSQAEKGSSIIIRAHGASDKDILDAKLRQISIIDATCPYVQKSKDSAKQMEKEGFRVVMLGQKEHPEVRGISESLNSSIVIRGMEDIRKLNGLDRVGIISQTTHSQDSLNSIIRELRKKGVLVKVENTICTATSERQASAIDTAKKADLMLVIGDKTSANTKKLADICSKITDTRYIEGSDELKKEWFEGVENVGITAGASTPDNVVEDVVKRLNRINTICF